MSRTRREAFALTRLLCSRPKTVGHLHQTRDNTRFKHFKPRYFDASGAEISFISPHATSSPSSEVDDVRMSTAADEGSDLGELSRSCTRSERIAYLCFTRVGADELVVDALVQAFVMIVVSEIGQCEQCRDQETR